MEVSVLWLVGPFGDRVFLRSGVRTVARLGYDWGTDKAGRLIGST